MGPGLYTDPQVALAMSPKHARNKAELRSAVRFVGSWLVCILSAVDISAIGAVHTER